MADAWPAVFDDSNATHKKPRNKALYVASERVNASSLQEISDGQIVAIDGKTLRRSYDKASGKSAIHMVSAWATANHISLGQVVVDAKSNEITAIPKLLELIEISGALVTIDAMGCQTEIAAKIVDAKADYCLAAKGNQPTLHEGLVAFFDDHLEDDFARYPVRRFETEEKAHGASRPRLELYWPSGPRMQLPISLLAFHPSYRNQQTAPRCGLQRHHNQSQVDHLTIKARQAPLLPCRLFPLPARRQAWGCTAWRCGSASRAGTDQDVSPFETA